MLQEVIKRDGKHFSFRESNIRRAILNANRDVSTDEQASEDDIDEIIAEIKSIKQYCVHIEVIQDMVETMLMKQGHHKLAKEYIIYRYIHNVGRQLTETEESVIKLIRGTNFEVQNENSNKNATVNSTQRDLMAGEISKDIAKKFLIPDDILKAYEQRVLHWHDMDYTAQPLINCCLLNIEDVLNNGTVMNGLLIESPHSFRVACNVMTQVIANVASNQYGGQSVAIKHLGKFVAISRERTMIKTQKKWDKYGLSYTDEQLRQVVEDTVLEEIKDGVQTIQYQINTLFTSNGQSPFLTIFMHLDEDNPYVDDIALIIQEIIRQRIEGVKNKDGKYITPAFPKLIYVLDDNNCLEGGRFDYITRECIKCNIKRMYPDYISAKIMREEYDGEVFSPMGCVDGKEVITYKFNTQLYVESFERMWSRLSQYFVIKEQQKGNKDYLYLDTDNLLIYDTKLNDFTKVKRVIRNLASNWVRLKFNNGRTLLCTSDHPLETENRGVVHAKDLLQTDVIKIGTTGYDKGSLDFNKDKAWLLGLMLCDSCYASNITLSIAKEGEDDIQDKYIRIIKDLYGLTTTLVTHERGSKGNYKDIIINASEDKMILFRTELIEKFSGVAKKFRHIPNEVFSWNYEARLNFMAGMIDADGYFNDSVSETTICQIGSTNKELALQQMYLAQSLGLKASMYLNKYKKSSDDIRYRVEFFVSDDLAKTIVCKKKREHFIEHSFKTYRTIKDTDVCNLVELIELDITDFSYDVTTESEHFEVSGIYSHNCRSFLSPWKDPQTGKYKWEGRFNQGVVSINLPQIGIEANHDMDTFWHLLDERLALCYKALLLRHKLLENTLSDTSPIHWQDGVIARLPQGESINELLHNGYSTISLGYIGIYETVQAMLGVSHTNPNGKEFALKIMRRLNNACEQWKRDTGLGFGLYGTPAESLCYNFQRYDAEKYGIIENVTDHGFYTNSYHIFVNEDINAFDKFSFESEFQKLSSGGCISYVELPYLTKNEEAIAKLVNFIYHNIKYAEFNTKSDYCYECGFEGEILLNNNNHWECPQCHNTNMRRLLVTRRTCGYLGLNDWNEGKRKEIGMRKMHL